MNSSEEFIIVWKIRSFSCRFYPCGDAIDSPVFTANNFGGSQWFIRLYPSGEDKERSSLFSIYLYNKKSDKYSEVISYELELIVDMNGTLHTVKSESQIPKKDGRFGEGLPFSLHSVSNGLQKWPKNVLTVRCHLFKSRKERCFPDIEIHSEIPVSQVSFLWTVKISDVLSKSVHKDVIITPNLRYEIALIMLDNVLKICVSQKGDSILPSFVECKLSLVKPNGNVLKSESSTHLFETNDKNYGWDFPAFIKEAELDRHGKCWGDDNFSLFCEISASTGIKPVVTNSGYTTRKVEGNSTVLSDFKNMLHNHIHSDIKLKVENEELLAHKSILAVRSPVFSAMFDQEDMSESQTGVINIPDFEVDVVKLFLEFLYTDSIEHLNYEKAKKLVLVADKYQVTSLVEKCTALLELVLSLENIIEILKLSDMIGHEHLKRAALNFIAINSKILFITPELKELMQENVKLAHEVLSNISLNFKVNPIT